MIDFVLRPASEDEWPAFLETVRVAHGAAVGPGDEAPEKRTRELERSVASATRG